MKDRAWRTFLMRLTTSILSLGLVVIPHFSVSTDGRTHAGTSGMLWLAIPAGEALDLSPEGTAEQTSSSQSTAIKPRPRDTSGHTSTAEDAGVRRGETSASSSMGDSSTPSHAAASSSCGTPYDTIPNFAFSPTMVSLQDGPWSSPSTWSLGRVPQAQDILVLHHQVTYDSLTGIADVIGIDVGASLRFRTDISTRLQVGILKLFDGGTLEIGTATTPVAPTVTAELIIRDRPLNLTTDPGQFGTGLLSVNGTVVMHGAVKTPTFVRTAV